MIWMIQTFYMKKNIGEEIKDILVKEKKKNKTLEMMNSYVKIFARLLYLRIVYFPISPQETNRTIILKLKDTYFIFLIKMLQEK